MEQSSGEPCCYAGEYGKLFSGRGATRDVKAFRKRGLEPSARDLVDGLIDQGVEDATVLEIGGGVGAIQVELLEAGASATTNVDLSPEWERAAAALLDEHGLTDKVDRRLGDFIAVADDVEEADVVILHRVVCCYPHWDRLLGHASAKARRAVAVTFPRDRWQARLVIGLENLTRWIRRQQFRAFVHPAEPMLALIERSGFSVTSDKQGMVWRSVVLHRAA